MTSINNYKYFLFVLSLCKFTNLKRTIENKKINNKLLLNKSSNINLNDDFDIYFNFHLDSDSDTTSESDVDTDSELDTNIYPDKLHFNSYLCLEKKIPCEIIKWINKTKLVTNIIITLQNVDILYWLKSNYECETLNKFTKDINDILFKSAIRNGRLDVLKFIIKYNFRFIKNTCTLAVEYGQLEILKWARKNNCSWDTNTCAMAAKNGYLYIIKWARKKKCPWDKLTCEYAILNNHLHILKWARKKKCPWDKVSYKYAIESKNSMIIQWMNRHRCPK
jgi:hypothetical protein